MFRRETGCEWFFEAGTVGMRGESQGLGNSATRLTASEVKSEAKLIASRRLLCPPGPECSPLVAATGSVQNWAPAGIGHQAAVK